MSSNVNCSTDLTVCDRKFDEYASTNGSLDLDAFIIMINDLFNQFRDQFDSSSSLTDQLVKVFNIFDLNCDGFIDKDEFKSMWIKWLSIVDKPKSSLIVVDLQNDFIAGALALENCLSIIPLINSLIDNCSFDMIVYTLDWHPENHISFVDNVHLRKLTQLKDNADKPLIVNPFDCISFEVGGVQRKQIVYPKHCVQSSWGSQLHDNLKVIDGSIKIFKGTNPDVDSYSGFKDNEGLSWTQLDEQLKEKGITDVYICGLAYDICVYHTIKDSLSLNYRTIMVEDCCRGTEDNQIAIVRQELIEKGCLIVETNKVESMVAGITKSWQLAYQAALNLAKSE